MKGCGSVLFSSRKCNFWYLISLMVWNIVFNLFWAKAHFHIECKIWASSQAHIPDNKQAYIPFWRRWSFITVPLQLKLIFLFLFYVTMHKFATTQWFKNAGLKSLKSPGQIKRTEAFSFVFFMKVNWIPHVGNKTKKNISFHNQNQRGLKGQFCLILANIGF